MKQAGWFRVSGFAAIALFSLTLTAQTGDPKDLLLNKLREQFAPTRFTADNSDIVTAGVVVALKKDGMLLYPANLPAAPTTVYKNGKLSQGFGDMMKVGMVDGMGRDGGISSVPTKTMVTGEKVWVKAIDLAKDSIQVQVVTDPYDDGRYFAILKFLIPKGSIPAPDDGVKMISEVLEVQQQDQPAQDQGGQQAQGTQQAGFSGQYFLKETGSRLQLLPDGSFTLFAASGVQSPGQFAVNGDTLTLTYKATGRSASFKIQGDQLLTDTGLAWVRTGDASAPSESVTSQAQDSTPPPLAGEYTAPSGSRILLLPDGTFTKFVGGGQGHGQYAADGNDLTLTFASTGFSQKFKIQGGTLLDVNTQQGWVRTGDAPVVAAAPMPEIAPPPPPADAAPPTIAVGQTRDQVKAAFGQPLRVAKIGTKEIYYYKDMKVTFTNGKVSNVQ